jgi:hypothetical protein
MNSLTGERRLLEAEAAAEMYPKRIQQKCHPKRIQHAAYQQYRIQNAEQLRG